MQDGHATVAANVDLLDLAGTVSVPVAVRGLPWDEIRKRAWRARAQDVIGAVVSFDKGISRVGTVRRIEP